MVLMLVFYGFPSFFVHLSYFKCILFSSLLQRGLEMQLRRVCACMVLGGEKELTFSLFDE